MHALVWLWKCHSQCCVYIIELTTIKKYFIQFSLNTQIYRQSHQRVRQEPGAAFQGHVTEGERIQLRKDETLKSHVADSKKKEPNKICK